MTTETNETILNESSAETTASVEAPKVTESVTNSDWRASLPEDIRDDKTFESIKSVEDLAKGYRSAQKMIGGRIPIPSEDASDEVKNEFYQKVTSMPNILKLPDSKDPKAQEELGKIYDKLGRPSSADKYQINIPDDFKGTTDEGYLKTIKEVAHKAGLSQSQLQALSDVQLQRSQELVKIVAAQKEATRSFLQKEWGNTFDEHKEAYRSVMSKFEERFPDAVAELKNGYAGNNPVVILMAAELGKMYRENGTISPNSRGTGGMTPEAAKSQIADIMSNKQHAYHDSRSPAHSEAVAKVQMLYKDAYPEPKENNY